MVHRELSSDESKEALPKAGLLHFWKWAFGRYKRFRVAGASMRPTLEDGWTVLVDYKAMSNSPLLIGDVVLARFEGHSQHPCIKRVHALSADSVDLRGDNPAESTDSTVLGPVPHTAILAKVICTFP